MPTTNPEDYRPNPLDTSHVTLDETILMLVEHLANNVHDQWSRQRLIEGWRYAAERSDERKLHPDLVPYDDLPDREKAYDRTLVLETLRSLVALGYGIQRPDMVAAWPEARAGYITSLAAHDLRAVERADDATTLVKMWQAHDEGVWSGHPELYIAAAEHLRRAGRPLAAFEVVAEGLRYWPAHLRLRQLQALALAQSGASDRAIGVLTTLLGEGGGRADEMEETLGMLGRIHKDLAQRLSGPESFAEFALAREAYERAFRLSGGFYSGINAATTALLAGDGDRARGLALAVRTIASEEVKRLRKTGGDLYWALATVGEANLILGDTASAANWYRSAEAAGRARLGDLSSTRRNAKMIVAIAGIDATFVDRVLPIPRVAAFVAPARSASEGARPSYDDPDTADLIARRLVDHNIGVGFSSAGAGSEILFLERVSGHSGETCVVLPYDAEEFVEDWVAPGGVGPWRARFEKALGRAAEVIVATDRRFARGTTLRDYADQLLLGLARTQSLVLETELVVLIAVDDDKRHAEIAPLVDNLRAHGHRVEIIDVRPVHRGDTIASPAEEVGPSGASGLQAWGSDTRILGILFADVVHSSQLTDDQQPLFVERFLGQIGRCTRESPHAPLWKNTWGDGMYFVFETVDSAGQFALELRDRIGATDWAQEGLRAGLTLRIGLHAGPIFSYIDPVTGYQNFTGRHTIRGARIEPVTLPGQVYASREFTALAAAGHVDTFLCIPVGQVLLAKRASVSPLFVLEWASKLARDPTA